MKTLIKTEFKRAFINPMLVISICIGCGISLWQFFTHTFPYPVLNDYTTVPPGTYPPSLFVTALGMERISVAGSVFFYMLPILAVIPFADSFFTDLKSGYIKNVFTRTSKSNYYTAKYIAVFLSAAAAVSIPMLLNFFLTAACKPMVIPEPNTGLFHHGNIMWGKIYFSRPALYYFLYILLDASFAGIFACLAITLSFFLSNRFLVIVSPFIIYIFVHAAAFLAGQAHFDICMFLAPSQGMIGLRFYHVLICALILFAIPLGIYIYRGRKDETF